MSILQQGSAGFCRLKMADIEALDERPEVWSKSVVPGLADKHTLGEVVLAEVDANVATNLRDRENGFNSHDCEC